MVELIKQGNMKPTFIKGDNSRNAEKAEKVLENANIDFREMFSRDPGKPTLVTDMGTYTGLPAIKGYCSVFSS